MIEHAKIKENPMVPEVNIDEIVLKFKERLVATKEAEKFRNEVVEPLVDAIFREDFINTFDSFSETINKSVGNEVIKHYIEDNNRYVIEGMYHKIYFQKSHVEIVGNNAYVNIIPVYVWKELTKHLGPISLIVNVETRDFKWEIQFESIKSYATKVFAGLIDDKDFNI